MGTAMYAPRRALGQIAVLERLRDWKWLDGVYAMQLSVRGNQNEDFEHVGANIGLIC